MIMVIKYPAPNEGKRSKSKPIGLRTSWRSVIQALPHNGENHPYVFHLILRQKWKKLHFYLSTREGRSDAANADSIRTKRGLNVLHLACELRPPLYTVCQIIHLCPQTLRGLDWQGRTPLHLAAERRNSSEVVVALTRGFAGAASMTDVNGDTPLHLLCKNSSLRHWCSCGEGDSATRAARVLCEASPSTMTLDNLGGVSALEYAICVKKHADRRLINYMMGAIIAFNEHA